MEETKDTSTDVKITPVQPWENFKKDRDLDAKLKRNKEYLKTQKYKRQFSRGTAPGRGKGESVLLSTSRKYSSIRAATSGEIRRVPFECDVMKSLRNEKQDPLKNKVFSDLTLAQQLEVLKRKNQAREVVSDDESDSEEDVLESDRTKGQLTNRPPEQMQKIPSKERETKGKEDKEKQERKIRDSGNIEKPRDNQESKKGKQTERRPIRQPVKLHMDEISEEFSQVTFCKLDRLTKAVHAHLDTPSSKNTDLNRVDNAIAKWALKM